MDIINLTHHERWKMNVAQNTGYTHFYDPRDHPMRNSLVERGLITHTGNGNNYRLTTLGTAALDYLDSKKEQEDQVWEAIQNTVDSIKRSRIAYSGTSRGPADYVHYEDGTLDGRCKYTSGNKDGSNTVFLITGTLKEGQVVVKIDESEDHADWFWGPGGERDGDDPERRVVVEGTHYYLGADKKDTAFKGHAGRRFEIEFFDGRQVVTNDLWYQGVIPPKWRERFPDNARFIPQPQPVSLAERLGLEEKN